MGKLIIMYITLYPNAYGSDRLPFKKSQFATFPKMCSIITAGSIVVRSGLYWTHRKLFTKVEVTESRHGEDMARQSLIDGDLSSNRPLSFFSDVKMKVSVSLCLLF